MESADIGFIALLDAECINALDGVSNDPDLWPTINLFRFFSYFIVASSTAVVYDWVSTFGQEFELVWRRHWSFINLLYFSVRYIGILYSAINMLACLPSVSVTDIGCTALLFAQNWTSVVVNAMLGVIMMARLNAMYQQSKKMLVCLIVILSAVTIACVVITSRESSYILAEELVFSGAHFCACNFQRDPQLLITERWIIGTAWEVLALCLAVWIAVKHFRELERPSAGWTVGDCFTVLIKTHVHYFVAFAAVSCLTLGLLSPKIAHVDYSAEAVIYNGLLGFASDVQMFVLGPRLILSIREYHAKLVANSDDGADLTTVIFQECVDE